MFLKNYNRHQKPILRKEANKLQFDEQFINQVAKSIADKSFEYFKDHLDQLFILPVMLTKDEVIRILKCNHEKMDELLKRPDFPVNQELHLIPSHLLKMWIDRNTRWLEINTDYFE